MLILLRTQDLGSFQKSERIRGEKKAKKKKKRASRDKCKNEAVLGLFCCLLR